MIVRIWTLYTVEIVKALRMRQTWLGPLIVLCVVFFGPLMHTLHRDGVSDYHFIARVIPMALDFPGFILLMIWSAGLVSSEMNSGSIRQILVRPIYRFEYLTAKLLLCMTYALLLIAAAALTAWIMALVFGDLNGITYGGELIFTEDQMRHAFVLGAVLSLAPFFAAGAWGLMFSVTCRNPVTAVIVSLGIWIIADLIKYPLHIESWVFTTWLESPWQVFINRCDALDGAWFPMTWYCLGTSGAVLVFSFAFSVLIMHYRNIT
jgi:ABC-type transport system involved in multi-copper enzyme maturation permease subunit